MYIGTHGTTSYNHVYMYTNMCVDIFTFMYVPVHVYAYVFLQAPSTSAGTAWHDIHIYVCKYICEYIYIYMCIYIFMHTSTQSSSMHGMTSFTYAYMYIDTCI